MAKGKRVGRTPKDSNRLQVLIPFYQSAIQLKTHEGDLVWSRFNGFVVAHAIFFALIGQILLSKDKFPYPDFSLIVVSSIGFVLSFLWLISTLRGFEAVEYWVYSAIEFAEKIKNEVNISTPFSNGRKYFKENREVMFILGEEKEKFLQRSCITQCITFNTRWTAYLSIGIIMLLYLIILIATVNGLFKS